MRRSIQCTIGFVPMLVASLSILLLVLLNSSTIHAQQLGYSYKLIPLPPRLVHTSGCQLNFASDCFNKKDEFIYSASFFNDTKILTIYNGYAFREGIYGQDGKIVEQGDVINDMYVAACDEGSIDESGNTLCWLVLVKASAKNKPQAKGYTAYMYNGKLMGQFHPYPPLTGPAVPVDHTLYYDSRVTWANTYKAFLPREQISTGWDPIEGDGHMSDQSYLRDGISVPYDPDDGYHYFDKKPPGLFAKKVSYKIPPAVFPLELYSVPVAVISENFHAQINRRGDVLVLPDLSVSTNQFDHTTNHDAFILAIAGNPQDQSPPVLFSTVLTPDFKQATPETGGK